MENVEQLEFIARQADAQAIASDSPGQAQDGAAPAAPTGPDYAGEAAQIVDLFAAGICGYAPKAAGIWTDDAKLRVVAALVPVLEKYGFSMGKLPPEAVLLFVAGPIAWKSAQFVAAQMEADAAIEKAKKAAQEKPQGIAADMPQEGPAVAVHEQVKLYQ